MKTNRTATSGICFAIVFSILLIFTLAPVALGTEAEFANGSGTADDPYIIVNKHQLDNVRNHMDSHFVLAADIIFSEDDFSENGAFYNEGTGFVPFGFLTQESFSGSFDGNGFSIVNLQSRLYTSQLSFENDNPAVHRVFYAHSGLFCINKGTVCNLNLSNIDICVYTESIDQCTVTSRLGAIAGTNYGTISSCSTNGSLRNVHIYNSEPTIYTMLDVYAAGVTAVNCEGGTVKGCKSSCEINSYYAGGIAALSSGLIQYCINEGCINAIQSASGICGDRNDGAIECCFNSGNISAETFGSGITSTNGGTISNCYNSGTISAAFSAGIVSHWSSNTVSCCYNVGELSTGEYFGGIIIQSQNTDCDIIDCYYLNNIPDTQQTYHSEGTRCSYEDMTDPSTFAGFSFRFFWRSGDSSYPFPTLLQSPPIPDGDANLDGTVNAIDANIMRRYLAGYNLKIDIYNADINSDNSIDTIDVNLIKRKLAGE